MKKRTEESPPAAAGRPTNELAIGAYVHCAMCLEERPPGVSARDFARLGVGFTGPGIQVWCNRHECNVMHIDFEGRRHPADTTRPSATGDGFADRFLAAIGVEDPTGAFPPVFEDEPRGRVFVKFMSDGGATDDAQGDAFELFLKEKKIGRRRTGRRSFVVGLRALERAIGFEVPR